MIRTNVWTKLLIAVLLKAVTAFAQSPDRLPATDAEKIADALRAGPAFITTAATVRASIRYSCVGCRIASPAERRRLIASASRTCISALSNQRIVPRDMSSMLVRT